ncbi:ATP-binding protein [Actinomadura nitritigenes]|uniref:ATP-binding protein n=1 Tax=Actinomadura nitritigenes TaxID=134602 RepID=A0ABS3R2Q8_9ACTN|nr:ATP-binding protein [Actinomadura nitritigenes]MBO2440406.1 ATP-binding protein [Actinomadura nitritigenes]
MTRGTVRTRGPMRLLGTTTLPGVARSAPEARAFVRRVAPHIDAEALADITLCVDELVANACEHTASGLGGRVTVIVSAAEGTLRVTVLDDGGTGGAPCVRDAPCGEDGRGLRLVDALSTAWGSHGALGGTAVWAEFHAPAAPRTPCNHPTLL